MDSHTQSGRLINRQMDKQKDGYAYPVSSILFKKTYIYEIINTNILGKARIKIRKTYQDRLRNRKIDKPITNKVCILKKKS